MLLGESGLLRGRCEEAGGNGLLGREIDLFVGRADIAVGEVDMLGVGCREDEANDPLIEGGDLFV